MGEYQLFVCGGHRNIPRCSECGFNAVARCSFKLGGSKAGQTCARTACASHGVRQPDGSMLCRPHHDLTQRRAGR